MNLFARLLLDRRVDFCFFFNLSIVSKRILLKQSGILARIEGVVSGSNSKGRVLSPEARTSVHDSVIIRSLRGHIMYERISTCHFIGLIFAADTGSV